VVVEVFLFRVGVAHHLAYRRLSDHLRHGESPDQAARRLANVPDSASSGSPTLVHSTSWRCERDTTVVLTYAVAPDPALGTIGVEAATPLDGLVIATGDEPNRPTPTNLTAHHVASHAARHLAFLLRTDPQARSGLAGDAELLRLLDNLQPALAGELTSA